MGMSQSVREAITSSADDFRDVVWPVISGALGGGRIDPMETITDNETAKLFDTLAGVDAWQWLPEGRGVRGLASRVQWRNRSWKGSWPFNTFTVRRSTTKGNDTEYDKRLWAIIRKDLGLIYPYLTIQAYLESQSGAISSVGVVRTEHLIRHIDPSERGTRWVPVAGGNTMYVVTWDELVAGGVPLWRWDPIIGQITLSRNGGLLV